MSAPNAIASDQVAPLLLAACPSFCARGAEICDANLDVHCEGGRLNYVDAGDFVQHLITLKLNGNTAEFQAVFEVIERLLCDGDDYVRNLAAIGYIEGMQMMSVTEAGLSPERDFRPHLLPSAEACWQRLNDAWGSPAG